MKIGFKLVANFGGVAPGMVVRAAAQAAEEAGFSTFWTNEHVVLFTAYPRSHYPYPSMFTAPDPRLPMADPIVAMTWAAAVTTTIEVGSSILILPQRNPVVLAKELATLDAFSEGRVVLGTGLGWSREEYEAIGADYPNRARLMDEHIGAMRALWREDSSSFAGETIRFEDAYLYPKPVRKDLPILIGGESEAAMRRVARLADGWLPLRLPVEEAAAQIARLKALVREHDRDPERLRIVATVNSATSGDDLARYRDAGVTEFILASYGELELEPAALRTGIARLGAIVERAARL
jgi:probable F420-dependent oxidoreductase